MRDTQEKRVRGERYTKRLAMVYWDQTTECKTLRIHSYLDELLLMLR